MFSIINFKKITDFYGVKEHLRLNNLRKHPLFFLGLGIRILFILSISPYIHNIWFLPFIRNSITDLSLDPWTSFVRSGGDQLSFPYGIVMYFSYKIPAAVGYYLDTLWNSDIFLRLSFGVSSLFFDLGTLIGIAFISKKYSIKTLLLFYWCSPVVIYILYWHGQLDIVPIFLLIICIALMHIEKPIGSGIFMGLAILAKSSMLISLPFLIIYYLRNKRITNQLPLNLIPLGFLLLINSFIYFKSYGFNEMVIQSPESSKLLFLDIGYGGELKLFLLPLIFILILYTFWRLERITLDLLCISIGIGFFSILILLPPSPGWFLWIVPFLTLYQIRTEENYSFSSLPFYIFFIAYYILYASGASINYLDIDLNQPNFKYFSFQKDIFKSLIFTGLQTSSLLLSLKMYQFGIWRNNYYAGIRGKLAIGFVGNKNQIIQDIINSLKKILVNEWIVNLSTENYRKFNSQDPMNKILKINDQKIFNLINFSKDFFNIINKRNIENASNNFNDINILNGRYLENNNIVFVSGFNSLDIKRIRDRLNLKISLELINPSQNSRILLNQKLKDLSLPHNNEFDLSIFYAKNNGSKYISDKNSYEQLYISMANGFFHEKLVRNLIALSSLRVDVEQSSNLEKVHLVIDGDISSEDILVISKNMIINSEDLIFFGTKWSEGMQGIIELVITIHIADLMHQRSI